MKTIMVYEVTGERAVLDSDGDIIFAKIIDCFNDSIDVVLDFDKVNTILSIFMNSAIAQLYRSYNSDYLNTHLSIVNMSNEDRKTLKRVNDRAKQYFSDKTKMENFLKEDVFDE